MNAQTMMKHADHCLDQASECLDDVQRAKFIRAAKAWRSLAHAKRMADTALLFSTDDVLAIRRAVS
jgi:hypothetical protein